MNYIGSKIKLLPFIDASINKVVDENCKVFCDLFSGTGSVSAHFKKKGFKVIANDIQYYAYVLNRQLITNHTKLKFNQLKEILPELNNMIIDKRKDYVCDYLTKIEGKEGFIYLNYSPSEKSERMYLTNDNAKKCDAVRMQIENWKTQDLINEEEYFFLIASLIKSTDLRANVLSVYGAYLKHFKSRAQVDLIIKPYELILNKKSHDVHNEDANELVKKVKTDILYLDPPYNSRQYGSNYHLLETIAKYDAPEIYGKTGLREYGEQRSLYCLKEHATKSLKDLIDNAKAKYIFLSYSNEGIIPQEDIKSILESKGKYGYFETKYSRYKSDSKRTYTANHTIEYLHYCIVDGVK